MSTPISEAFRKYKSLGIPPALETLALAAAAYGGTRALWHPMADTVMSLARMPMRHMGMSDQDIQQASDNLHSDPLYRKWIPAGMAAILAGVKTGFDWRGNERFGGLFKHDAKPVAFTPSTRYTWKQPMIKNESYDELTNSYTLYNGQDMTQRINADGMVQLFQDPNLTPYAMNMGTAIVNNAINNAGVNNPTLGNVFDSAMDKFQKKLSFGGLAEIGAKTVIANSMANLFTSALGTMTDLSPETRQNLVDLGTWAGAINAIVN